MKGEFYMGVEEIKKRCVVAVIRGASIETIIPMARALKDGGSPRLKLQWKPRRHWR